VQTVKEKTSYIKTRLYMGTIISIKVVTEKPYSEVNYNINRAFKTFQKVEEICSRFSDQSEVMQLLNNVGEQVKVSEILYQAVRYACKVAEITGGMFDPSIGQVLESKGFNRHYLTRNTVKSTIAPSPSVSYEDIIFDDKNKTVTLMKPLIIDLGAVAKGFAIDLAANVLRIYEGFYIEAGGDIFAGGKNEQGRPWKIGIRCPFNKDNIIGVVEVSDKAVCTSGSYERVSPNDEKTHHLLNPKSGKSETKIISSTVVAPFAMMADTLSTAAFILGEKKGIELLEENGLAGLLLSPDRKLWMTKEMEGHLNASK